MDPVKETEESKFSVVRNPECEVIHVDGVYGTLTPATGQLTFYQDVPKVDIDENGLMSSKSIERVLVVDTRMSPEVFRSIAYWMIEHVQYYEKWMVENFRQQEGMDNDTDQKGSS